MRRLTPYLLLTVLVVGSGVGLGSAPVAAASNQSPPCAKVRTFSCLSAISFTNTKDGYGLYPLDDQVQRLAVVATSDAGRTWRRVGMVTNPGAGYGIGTDHLFFADTRDGFVLGPTGALLATHDGGTQWVALSSHVLNVSVSAAVVWSVVDSCPSSPAGTSTTPCTVGIERSRNGGQTWKSIPSFPTTPYEGASVAAVGANTVLVAAWRPVANQQGTLLDAASGQLMVSGDAGATWVVRPLPCTQGYNLDGLLSVARTTGTIWLACVGQGGGGHVGMVLYQSGDDGATWTAESDCPSAAQVAASTPQDAPCGDPTGLVPLDSQKAFATEINGGLVETTDGGAIWHPVAAVAGLEGAVPSLVFVSKTSGWINFFLGDLGPLAKKVGLWHTADGGRTWQPITTR